MKQITRVATALALAACSKGEPTQPRAPVGWGAYQHPEWGAMKLGHTHPERSSSGLLSVLAIAYASTHARELDLPKVAPYMRDVEDSIVHYGSSTGFFADKMIERGPS